MDDGTGAVLLDVRPMQRVWARLAAQASRSHGPTLRIQLLAPCHPDAVSAAAAAAQAQALGQPELVRLVPVGRSKTCHHARRVVHPAQLLQQQTHCAPAKASGLTPACTASLAVPNISSSSMLLQQVAPPPLQRAYLPPGVAKPASRRGIGSASQIAAQPAPPPAAGINDHNVCEWLTASLALCGIAAEVGHQQQHMTMQEAWCQTN